MYATDKILEVKRFRNERNMTYREIRKATGLSFGTIKSFVEHDGSERVRAQRHYSSKLDGYRDELKTKIESDASLGKQKRTVSKLYEEACEEHPELSVSLSAFCAYVAKMKKDMAACHTAHVPLEHKPGEAQVDFGEIGAYIRGRKIKLKYLVMSFPYSNRRFCRLYRSENLDCLIDGLVRFFESTGGVPRKILFDNASSMVSKVAGRKRILTERFEMFKAHYGFEAVFCNPASGNEKGHVENAVKTIRMAFFCPLPRLRNLDAYNESLNGKCAKLANRRHYRKKTRVCDLFVEDRKAFRPLPQTRFALTRTLKARSDKCGLVRFENNFYGTCSDGALRDFYLDVSADRVDISDSQRRHVVSHERSYDRGVVTVNFEKYRSLLVVKPRAILDCGAFDFVSESFVSELYEKKPQERCKMIDSVFKRFQEPRQENVSPPGSGYGELCTQIPNSRPFLPHCATS